MVSKRPCWLNKQQGLLCLIDKVMHPFHSLEDKQEIVFVGYMELGWELARWSAPINRFIATHPNKICHVATLPDRIDLYKGYYGFHPIYISGLYISKRPCMFTVFNLEPGEQQRIRQEIQTAFPTAHLCYPPYPGTRDVFRVEECDFAYQPRPANREAITPLLTDRPVVTVASRHRLDSPIASGTARNWLEGHWCELFRLLEGLTVFVAGTSGSYIRPPQNLGICLEDLNEPGTSTIGLTIEAIRASRLTIGQQSANPLLSLLLGVPVISWGHEKQRHAVDENPLGTACHFFDDPTYSITPEAVYSKIKEML